jgi:hypothetical protein
MHSDVRMIFICELNLNFTIIIKSEWREYNCRPFFYPNTYNGLIIAIYKDIFVYVFITTIVHNFLFLAYKVITSWRLLKGKKK